MRLDAISVQAGKKLTYDKDQSSQVINAVTAHVQGTLVNFVHEHLVDGLIKQGVFILKVRVKSGAVDFRLVGHILNGDALEVFFSEELLKGLQDQVTGAFDARVELFIEVRQHIASFVA